jgi:hypothetical protein
MPKFQVAHIREQGVDLIIILVDSSFGYKSVSEQNQVTAELQLRTRAAGLAGTVVPVWENGGRLAFLAPPNWHPFFSNLTPEFIAANINRELYW